MSFSIPAGSSSSSSYSLFLPFRPHPNRNRYYKPYSTEHVDRHVTRERIKQSVPVVAGADGVDEGVTEGAGEDAFRGLVDSCHGELSDEDSDKKH